MARILINEPNDDLRRLLERVIARLGHEPIAVLAPSPQQLTRADVLLLEPASPIGEVLAQAAHLIDPSIPLVSVGADEPPRDLAGLGVVFAAVLVKPFTLEQLDTAIELALRMRPLAERAYDARPDDRAA
jgi:CheY-like chemotaxis protein